MIIDCPVCNKKFDIDQDLIPADGRLLQCGSCNHKWFFKLNMNEKKPEEEIKIKAKKDFNINVESTDKNLKKEKNIETEEINFLNIILVIIISTTAFIFVLDTFKNQLTSVFPNIKFLLNNLYQSIEDIKLFILDLIK